MSIALQRCALYKMSFVWNRLMKGRRRGGHTVVSPTAKRWPIDAIRLARSSITAVTCSLNFGYLSTIRVNAADDSEYRSQYVSARTPTGRRPPDAHRHVSPKYDPSLSVATTSRLSPTSTSTTPSFTKNIFVAAVPSRMIMSPAKHRQRKKR